MRVDKANPFITQYSNRFYLLNTFSDRFIKLNDYISIFNQQLYVKGIRAETLKIASVVNSLLRNVANILFIFMEEAKSKRKNTSDIEELEKKLRKAINLSDAILSKMISEYNSRNYDKVRKSTSIYLKNLDGFMKLISEINKKIGLFDKDVTLSEISKNKSLKDLLPMT